MAAQKLTNAERLMMASMVALIGFLIPRATEDEVRHLRSHGDRLLKAIKDGEVGEYKP